MTRPPQYDRPEDKEDVMYRFPLNDNENILKKSLASLHLEDNAFTGALYLTDQRIVFVGYVVNITRKYLEDIPLEHVAKIEAGKTFWVVPNVIDVTTIRNRKFKIIVNPGERNEWLGAIKAELDKQS
jgi:hypothetical protein